ncbi:hypothetical protein BDV96DRAFT_610881 [Lophiotrema nucula]|uniref:Tat pathway signal sequence n=1 Tax=Lophiotrema nucula TaxID=690887 RepID=A0A6A5ZLG8_9PLEO|nr:hypothetical protein BDV96DRAFT_610881 [Lophiotrema nucula]
MASKDDGTEDDRQTLLPCSSSTSLTLHHASGDHQVRGLPILIATILICTFLNVGLAVWVAQRWKDGQLVQDGDRFCVHHLSRWSPLVEQVEPNWHTVLFNGSFLKESSYRGPAGPETDAAWEALGGDYRSVVIPETEAEEAGLGPDHVRISQHYGGGLPANVEGLHHIHCLNLLRKTLWWNYEYYRDLKLGAFKNAEFIVRYHATHCLDILRQQLMCVPDVGVFGQVWYQPEGEPRPIAFTDFNTKHKCRDHEAVRKWAEEHQLPPEKDVDMSLFYEMPGPGVFVNPEVP